MPGADMRYVIADKNGKWMKTGAFSHAEMRMAAKAGFRVFVLGDSDAREITQGLTGLFNTPGGRDTPH